MVCLEKFEAMVFHGLQCEPWVPWRSQPSLWLLQTLLLLTTEHISLAPREGLRGAEDEWESGPFSAPG